MQKEALKLYKELKDYVAIYQFFDEYVSVGVDGNMDTSLIDLPLNFGKNIEKFCSHSLYRMINDEKMKSGKSQNSICSEVEILDVCNKDVRLKGIGEVKHKIMLFKVSENQRYLIDAERVFMIDGYYIYHSYTKNDTPFHALYYINNKGDEITVDQVFNEFYYLCGLVFRNFISNLEYPKKINRYIECKENENYITFANQDNLIRSAYGSDILSKYSKTDGRLNSTIYYVCDDNRLLGKSMVFGLYNGYYVEVNKGHFNKLFFFGEDIENAINFNKKIKSL